MSCNTVFFKSKKAYDRYHKLDVKGNVSLKILDRLWDINIADEYENIFRTGHNEIMLKSKKACFKWIYKNNVWFYVSIFETKKEGTRNKIYAFEKLNEFWRKYSHGLIMFI